MAARAVGSKGAGVDVNHPFQGYALNAVDAKGRVSVPSNFRELIATRCRAYAPGDASISETELSISLSEEEDRLFAYDAIGIRKLSTDLRESVSDLPAAERRKALAALGSDEIGITTAVSFDSAGRLVLPEMLRDFAGIDKLALFWGNIDFFEIWDPLKAREAWANSPGKLKTLNYLLKQRGVA